jgi:aryl-alcohol dehydrogenase-like predicted oxidoreductase
MQSSNVRLASLRLSLTFFRIDYAITNKLTPFISMQNHYNLVYREEEREMFPTLKVNSVRIVHTVTNVTFV